MKLIESTNETITVQFSWAECGYLWHALSEAIEVLQKEPGILNELIDACDGISDPDEIAQIIYEADRDYEETVDDLRFTLKRVARLFPKACDLSEDLAELIRLSKGSRTTTPA